MKNKFSNEAAVADGRGQMSVREVPAREHQDYEATCEMLFGATCSGTDRHIIHGRFPFPIAYPTQLGHESVGRVVSVGTKVRNFKVGDIITRVGAPSWEAQGLHSHWGGFSRRGFATDHRAMREDDLPREQWDAFRIHQVVPSDIRPEDATMMITWRETLSYITRLGVKAGSRVLILGSGGNALSFAAHARNLGAEEIIVVGSAARRAVAEEAGATAYFSYRDDGYLKKLLGEFAGTCGFLIDAVGSAADLNNALPVLEENGTVGVYGIDDYGTYGINPWKAPRSFTVYQGGYDEEETHEAVIRHMRAGDLRAGIWLSTERSFALSDIHRAFDALDQKREIKALIRLGES